jgi:hypothetical protein
MATRTETGEPGDTGMNRRKMMLIAGGAVACAGALAAAPFRGPIKRVARGVLARTGPGQAMLSLADGTYEEWLNQVGATFSLGGRTSLKLVGVRALPSSGAPSGVRAQAFAAFFDPPAGQSVAPDLIYSAVHPTYGPLPLFLATAGGPNAPRRMVAVFS